MKLLCMVLLTFMLFKINANESCKKYLGEIADGEGKFENCVIHNAIPAKFCISCRERIYYLEEVYSTFMTFTDPIFKKTCKELYTNQDRMNVIVVSYLNNIKIWEDGYCRECYEKNDTTKLAEDVQNIVERNAALNTCIQSNEKYACDHCHSLYHTMNALYEKMKTIRQNRICFDVVDGVNRTQTKWFKDLKCSRRVIDLKAFTLTSSLLSTLPLIFYLALFIYTKRTERNHALLNELDVNEQQSESTANIASTSGVTSTSAANVPLLSGTEETSFPL